MSPIDFDYKNWQNHIESITAKFANLLVQKYTDGQESHGGHLWRKPCLQRALQEILDLVTYFDVIEKHFNTIQSIAQNALNGKLNKDLALTQIANICTVGNPEGIAEEDR